MKNISDKMTGTERRVALVLAGVFSARMLGLFMIVPIFSAAAVSLHGYSELLAGWAIGIYGLAQGILQIPLGRLSDRVGRMPVILGGLVLFAIGSVIAALSDNIYGVIAGRALQGAGAIAGAVMALAADLTREEHRLKVMALIGGSIGMSFTLAIILGPIIGHAFGLSGIFWLTSVLALSALLWVWRMIPRGIQPRFHRDTEVEWSWMGRVLMDRQLLRLDIGVLILHFAMTATFFSLPLIFLKQHGFELNHHWQVYTPMLLLSVAVVLPFIFVGEKKRQLRSVFRFAIVLLVCASLGLWLFFQNWWLLVGCIGLFFIGFNLLEASLPSLVAKFAPAAHRGTAMGAFSTTQFLGAFLGAVCAGWLNKHYSSESVFLINAIACMTWVVLAVGMAQPPYLNGQLLNVGMMPPDQAQLLSRRLIEIPGVVEALVIGDEGVAYLKVDKKVLDKEALYQYSVPANEAVST